MKQRPVKQKGIALLIVLMIVAFVSILATEMGARLQLQVRRAGNIKDNNQAYWYAMAAEQFARKSIEQILDLDKGVVHAGQPWTEEFSYPLEGGGIQATLVDMQACFNLNALHQDNAQANSQGNSNTPEMEAFYEMLTKLDADIPDYNAETLRDSLADWLDSDSQLRTYGAEDSDYESLQFPYLAANNLMVSKSELRLINGVEQSWLGKLMPQVCVIPGKKDLSINVNTLDEEQAPILAGMTGLTLDTAKGLIGSRPKDGWKDAGDFLQVKEIAALSLAEERTKWFSVTTEYFILHTKTRYNNATFSMASLFKLDKNKRASVVRREFGGVN